VAAALQNGFRAFRNRLLGWPGFQRWAADFPLTRGIAHSQTAALFNRVAGFVYSQTLLACVQLDVLETLDQGPQSAGALASMWAMSEDSALRLLRAAAALELVETQERGLFGLGPMGAVLLGHPGLRQMIAHHRLFYADLVDPVGLLRSGGGARGLSAFWPYAGAENASQSPAEAVSPYSALMAATQPGVAADLLAAYDVRRHRKLLDVGGGEGVFAAAAAQKARRLNVAVFDLPAVAARAEARFAAQGLALRSQAYGGDFLSAPLPEGHDLITLVRILHDHNDAGVKAILLRIREALAPGGRLVIAEPMSAAPKPDPVSDAYFGFYLLAMGRGRARRPAELKAFLREAGFRRFAMPATRTPSLLRVLVARP
jgi:demethylspheroidene O-methyltransferase